MKTLLLALTLLQDPLTNKDVIDLVRAGLSAEIVAAKIKASRPSFDTSPSALKELKEAGVPDPVILALLEASTPKPVAKAEPAEPAKPTEARFVPLADVKRIFVGPMGNSDDSERFRMLLTDELQERGFTVVDDEKEADAVLTGALATQLDDGSTKARASVRLKAPDGAVLWRDEFGDRFAFGLSRRDSVKLRADDVASALKDAVKKAGKKVK